MRRIYFLTAFIILNSLFLIPVGRAAVTPEELKAQIDEKNRALQEVNQKIQQTQKDLEATAGKSRTLQQEVKKADQQIGQLNLSIKGSEINISRLQLEVDSLAFDINDTRTKVNVKKSGVAQILRILQHKDEENALTIFLKNKSLADSMAELQNLATFNTSLSSEINDLKILDSDLSKKLDLTSQKKSNLELENENLKNKKTIVATQKIERQNLLAQTKNQEKVYQGLISDLEKQQNAISDQIETIENQLRQSFDPSLLPLKRPGVLAWPVQLVRDGGLAYITQHYGEKSYLYRGKAHNGMDLGGLPIGSPVFAAADGKVVAVDNNDVSIWKKYQYGKYVLIEHNNNLSTLYGHLSAQAVKVGAIVKKGDLIGYLGKTGYATGPHLHFGVYWTPSILMKTILPAAGLVPVGVTIAPEDYL